MLYYTIKLGFVYVWSQYVYILIENLKRNLCMWIWLDYSFTINDNDYQYVWFFLLTHVYMSHTHTSVKKKRSVQWGDDNNKYWTKTRTDKILGYMSLLNSLFMISPVIVIQLLFWLHKNIHYSSLFWSKISLDEIQKQKKKPINLLKLLIRTSHINVLVCHMYIIQQ